jgi:hypothetical protein
MAVESSESILKELDTLHDKYEYKTIFEKLAPLVKENPKNVDYLWRFARAHFDKGENFSAKEEKFEVFKQGLEYAK